MDNERSEREIRRRVINLRAFYMRSFLFGAIFLVTVIMWVVTSPLSYFWPMWILLGFGSALAVEYLSIWYVSYLQKYFSFLYPEWVEQEIQKQLASDKNKLEGKSVSEETKPRAIAASRTQSAHKVASDHEHKVVAAKKATSVKSRSSTNKAAAAKTTSHTTAKAANNGVGHKAGNSHNSKANGAKGMNAMKNKSELTPKNDVKH